ncbi:hypothetical protein [Ruminiclostridium cellobioparum]|jgi:hypothetical protein|uniref:hypothetical protein n=1 Tax=Ruminiclostridium cellobioparum TaxID=29355 RepID=UPI0028A75F31|nr:hypothetical protein [Ruminiclostridium cellobioparum]
MIKGLMIFAALLGILLIASGVLYNAVRPSVYIEREKEGKTPLLFLLERVTKHKIISAPLNFISKNKKTLVNRYLTKILELSEAGISLSQFYFLKFLCLLFFTGLFLAILYSNTAYQAKIIVETSGSDQILFGRSETVDHTKYQLYKQILENIDSRKLSGSIYSEKYNMVEDVIAEQLNTSDRHLLDEKTKWFLDTWQKVKLIETFHLKHLIAMIPSSFIPDMFFIISWLIKGSVYKREIIKLEYVFELLSKVEGIKTLDIINQLERSSKIYSKFFREFSHLFKYDKVKAFNFLKNRNIKSLTKIANILEIYSRTDKEIALQILEREIIERDEAIIMTADETVDFIDLAAFLSIVPLVYELARLMLDPMLDIVYKAFDYI